MTEETTEAGAPEAPVARIVSEKERFKTIDLDWPVEFEGKTYSEVTVRRCSAKEVADYLDGIRSNKASMPPNLDIPREVYDAMDDDDMFKIEEVARDFFPRRLRALMEFGPEDPEQSSPS